MFEALGYLVAALVYIGLFFWLARWLCHEFRWCAPARVRRSAHLDAKLAHEQDKMVLQLGGGEYTGWRSGNHA